MEHCHRRGSPDPQQPFTASCRAGRGRHAGIQLAQAAAAGNVIRYETGFTPGGFQVPSMIEGGVSFGQYRRSIGMK